MDLANLLPCLAPRSVDGPTERPVSDASNDSRKIGPTDIFVAIRGAQVDGRRFARTLDCAAVIADGPVEVMPGVTTILVDDARRALAQVAAAIHGHPARRLPVVGITGTNGKTTTAHLLEAALTYSGRTGLLLGTTGHRLAGQPIPARHTTPESPVIQGLLSRAQRADCDYAVMEVSSIGLDLRRVDALPFQVAAFTSFSQDHLDHHGDMDHYFDAKARLFTELLATDGIAILNADDATIADLRIPHRTVLRYGHGNGCDVRITAPVTDLHGCRAQVHVFGRSHTLSIPLVGEHNLENAICAFTIGIALGAKAETILEGLRTAPHVSGRLEPVPHTGQGPTVFVDYAHTPDALNRVLTALRSLTTGEVHTVFGCGGDRDREKRPLMGHAVETGSDHVWVTSDNPRTEDPDSIIVDIVAGIEGAAHTEVDRRVAIHAAIAAAADSDVVLIAGKGHETTQTIGTTDIPFDDMQVASEALARRTGGRS